MSHPLHAPIFRARLSISVAESYFRSRVRGCVIMLPCYTRQRSIVLTKIENHNIAGFMVDRVKSMWC